MKKFSGLLTCWLMLLAGVFVQGCRRDELVPLEEYLINRPAYVKAEAEFCMQPPDLYRQRLKYIFVVDKSSSNQNPPDATDPSGYRRYGPMSSFVQDGVDDPGYTYYSMVRFATSATVVQGFTDQRLAFRSVVDAEWNRNGYHQPADMGYTDYLSALDAVQKLITDDAKASIAALDGPVVSSVYVVIFVSDGAPVVPFAGDVDGLITQSSSSILAKSERIRALKTDPKLKVAIDDVVIHTGYYFETPDADAQALLADMAAAGSGNSYSFGSGANIDFTLFAVPVRKVRHILSELLVENENAVWWDDGRILRDSDRDGLPDEIEKRFQANALERDSDGNGVSDFVELRIKGQACKDPSCSRNPALRDNYAICTGLTSSPPFGTILFPDSDHDGLNDCEELILGSMPDLFDSNGDGIPDFMSLKAHLPFLPGSKLTSTDADSDGLNNYSEVKIGAPLFASNDRLLSFKPMTYEMRRLPSSEGDEDCYHVQINDITAMGPDNRIRVYLVENTSVIDDKKFLRIAEGQFYGIGDYLRFSNEDFKSMNTGGL